MLSSAERDMIRRRAMGQAPDPHGQADKDRLALLAEIERLEHHLAYLAGAGKIRLSETVPPPPRSAPRNVLINESSQRVVGYGGC